MRILKNLRIDEVSCVIKGANPGAQVMIRKSDDQPLLFNDIMLRKAVDAGADDEIDDDQKLTSKLKQMVAAMVAANPHISEEDHFYSLLHTAHGQQLARHLNDLSKRQEEPTMDIQKVIAFVEEGLMATVTKRDDETYAKAFSKKYENDIEFRKQWQNLTDTKHLVGMSKSLSSPNMMSVEVVSTEVGNTNVVDDSAKAVKQLRDLAEKQHRTFEEVFLDPSNAKLATATYTSAHRSSTSGSELERRRGNE